MKPLWVDFPAEEETFDIQDEHLVGKLYIKLAIAALSAVEIFLLFFLNISGSALLVYPVVNAGVQGVQVYFPGENEVCLDFSH